MPDLGDASLPSFFMIEHATCLEIYVSSSFDTSVNFKSKLLLYLLLFGEPENRLLGLENLPGDAGKTGLETTGVDETTVVFMLLSACIRGPDFFSSGRGLKGLCSFAGFCLRSLSRALSAAARAVSLLNFNRLHGLMLTWKLCFLVEEVDSGSPSILIDNFVEFWIFKKVANSEALHTIASYAI